MKISLSEAANGKVCQFEIWHAGGKIPTVATITLRKEQGCFMCKFEFEKDGKQIDGYFIPEKLISFSTATTGFEFPDASAYILASTGVEVLLENILYSSYKLEVSGSGELRFSSEFMHEREIWEKLPSDLLSKIIGYTE